MAGYDYDATEKRLRELDKKELKNRLDRGHFNERKAAIARQILGIEK